jgi:periplasmic divalent cation tolerance protein
MTDKRIVLSTAGSIEEARRIARVLVEEKLAACVNVVPQIESFYWWQEKVENAQEFLLIVKTTAELSADVCQKIKELHSYELPEAIEITISAGSAEYLDWIGASVE